MLTETQDIPELDGGLDTAREVPIVNALHEFFIDNILLNNL